MSNRRSHLLVGIDLGMTYLGDSDNQAHMIRNWENTNDGIQDDMVPTELAYRRTDRIGQPPIRVGYIPEKDINDPDFVIYRRFKTGFPHGHVGEPPRRVHDLYRDFLSMVYDRIKAHYSSQGYDIPWEDANVEFTFSIPASWRRSGEDVSEAQDRYRELREVASWAGFDHFGHQINDDPMIESDAVAAYCLVGGGDMNLNVENNCNILIVDAGGGTTDLSLAQVKDRTIGRVAEFLRPVDGLNLGSTYIDAGFERLSMVSLYASGVHQPPPEQAASQMTRSDEFQSTKHDFKWNGGNREGIFAIQVPDLPSGNDDANEDDEGEAYGPRVEHGRLRFKRSKLADLFDRQIMGCDEMLDSSIPPACGRDNAHLNSTLGIKGLIDNILDDLRTNFPDHRLHHVIFSGGLGRSDYVRKRIEEYLPRSRHSNIRGVQFNVPPGDAAQVSVSKGIVYQRRQEILEQQNRQVARWSASSYGVSRTLKTHRWSKVFHRRGKKRVEKMDWLIKKDEEFEGKQPRVTMTYTPSLDSKPSQRRCEVMLYSSHVTPPPKWLDSAHVTEILAGPIHCNFQDIRILGTSSGKPRRIMARILGRKSAKAQHIVFHMEATLRGNSINFECYVEEPGLAETHREST